MSYNGNNTMNVNDDHDDLVAVQERDELDAWLTACGLNPSLQRPLLDAIGISRLIHLKVVAAATMQSDLKYQGTLKNGDIALVMAGVDWYREWRDAPSPKPLWNLVCHADNFEAFVERWSPDELPRLRDAKAPVVAAMVAATPEPRHPSQFPARRLDPPTVASSPNLQDDTPPLLCIPTGELIDAKNTIQSHSIWHPNPRPMMVTVSPTLEPKEGRTGKPSDTGPTDTEAVNKRNETEVPGSNGGVNDDSGGSTSVADEISRATAPPSMASVVPAPRVNGILTTPPLPSPLAPTTNAVVKRNETMVSGSDGGPNDSIGSTTVLEGNSDATAPPT